MYKKTDSLQKYRYTLNYMLLIPAVNMLPFLINTYNFFQGRVLFRPHAFHLLLSIPYATSPWKKQNLQYWT
jgi:hypothetical protein